MHHFAPDSQMTSIIDQWGPYYVARVMAVIDGTWESSDTWGGMDTGMVEMAPYTNVPPAVEIVAKNLEAAITSGEFDPFGGKFTTGELLGMNKYLEGIDAQVPN